MKALHVKINLFEKDLSGSDASISLKGTHLVYIHSGGKYSSEKISVHADVYFKISFLYVSNIQSTVGRL